MLKIYSHGTSRPRWRYRLVSILAAVLLMATLGWQSPAVGGKGAGLTANPRNPVKLTGFTSPFRTVTLAALHTGRIKDIPVEEGDVTGAGEVAVLMDDATQLRRVEIVSALAKSTLDIELARVKLADAEAELERIENLDQGSCVSPTELRQARFDLQTARLALRQELFNHTQARREHALQQAALDQLSLISPFKGYISERLKEVGDTVEEREAILTVVQLDPLVVTLDCSLELAPLLHAGQRVLVQPLDATQTPRIGDVFFVNKVADPASQTFKVKIRVANSDNTWAAGMRVEVKFQRDVAVDEADSRVVDHQTTEHAPSGTKGK